MLKATVVMPLLMFAILGVPHAWSQEYPDRLIRVIVPYPAGATDTAARTVTKQLAVLFGKPVIVENKPGAGASIGVDFVARSTPDGYTLLWTSASPHTISPHLYNSLPYEPLGFTPITRVFSTAQVLAINANLPVTSVSDLLAYARANPGKASYGSAGIGITNHLAGELLQYVSGVPLVHVPYKGSGPATADLLSGRLAFMFSGVGQVLAHMKAGKVRVIGVADTVRHPDLPDVPTMEEAGLKGFDLLIGWHAVIGPLNMQRPVVNKLNQTIHRALADPDTKQQLNSLGYQIRPSSPEELIALMRANYDSWGKLIRAAKIEKM